ncbi:hypothetical protein [Actinomadura oligospora]|uniref:hypothetical protein n=1 Tax=Actinomadura oligospora TaxID=111804 RepID=UPI001475AE83|nr:hypothetical protein [Actinomadura oligospora]
MTENAEPPVEPPASPGPYRPHAAGRVVRGVAASALAGLAVLVGAAPPALASPAVQPVTTFGKVPEMGLKMVDGAALHCPAGVTTWSPMIVPIEMVVPEGAPNGTIDPADVKNMMDDSALWYRALGSTKSGGTMMLDKEWTQDGRRAIPITGTGLRSGTYLLGALCAKQDRGRHVYTLDANGKLVGEWYVVTFTWVDAAPADGTFHFERQYTSLSGSAPASAPAPTPAPTSSAALPHHDDGSGGMGWPGWLGIAAAVAAATAVGVGLSRRRRPAAPAGDLPSPVPGAPQPRRSPEDK